MVKSPETAARRLQDVGHQTTLHDSTNESTSIQHKRSARLHKLCKCSHGPISIRAAADDAVSKRRNPASWPIRKQERQRGPHVVLEGEQDATREAMKSRHLENLSPKQAEIIVEASETHQKGQKFEEILMKSQKTNQSQKIKGLTKAKAKNA